MLNFLRSIQFGIILLTIIILVSIVGTIIPQEKEGAIDVFHSWGFIALLLLLIINITLCSIEKISSKKKVSAGFFLTHLSLVLILLGGFIGGIIGEKGRLDLFVGEPQDSYKKGNIMQPLGFTVTLEKFELEHYGASKGELGVYKANKLVSVLPVETQKVYSLSDNTKVEIEEFVPDFSMDIEKRQVISRSSVLNNPAVKIKVTYPTSAPEEQWLFAKFPNFSMKAREVCPIYQFVYKISDGAIKNFQSTARFSKPGREEVALIQVNHPFRFQKYTFYQTSYNKDKLDYSGLQVVYDPAVPLVYSGFILLMSGLTMVLFENRKMGGR